MLLSYRLHCHRNSLSDSMDVEAPTESANSGDCLLSDTSHDNRHMSKQVNCLLRLFAVFLPFGQYNIVLSYVYETLS